MKNQSLERSLRKFNRSSNPHQQVLKVLRDFMAFLIFVPCIRFRFFLPIALKAFYSQ